MGCACSKGVNDEIKGKKKEKGLRKSSKRLVASSREDDVTVEVDNGGSDATTRLISTEPVDTGSTSTPWDEGNKKPAIFENGAALQMQSRASVEPVHQKIGQPPICRVFTVQNGVDGTQVVAGWPAWLTSVAGEAIRGWIPRKAESFEKLDKIGQGTYSSVFRARDLEARKIVALKKVRFVNMDPESVRFMAREILILRRLDHPNVMKLEGLVTSRVSGNLYLVFEYMEHDLSGLLASPIVKFTEPQIKCFVQQLFRGLEHCHSQGVLHRDIKGSNLLINKNGNLKIGDFGLATFFHTNQKQHLTSRVVTLWYRPPELLLGATDYGEAVDLWSSGCILAELFAGKPIMPGRTEVEQLHKIFKLCGSPSEEYWKKSKLPHATIFKPQHPYKRTVAETFKNFPPEALKLLESLLAFEPERRGTTTAALRSEFFTTKPLPCDPSSLPKYPPSKEFDAKMRDEARRRKPAGGGGGIQNSRKAPQESKAVPAPEANAELQASIQRWKGRQANPTSNSDVYNTQEDSGSGFPIEPSGASSQSDRNSLLVADEGLHSSYRELKQQRSFKPRAVAAHLSRFSNSVAAAHSSSQLDFSRDSSLNPLYDRVNESKPSNRFPGKQDPSLNNNGHIPNPEVYGTQESRIHYSGPLLPPDGSVEEMLKEHEKQIQIAVRKAREKSKMRKGQIDNGQTDSLLGG
ncbi:probable serine/threonine-protein kinase At1g09600 [Andrographis paniculata]|uniref:probable serine/threonine-protein kinase At1g09600 n=1 Tax=Andrographis paniculata TaxID=175694 RepID=UPI0021E7E011|nr:probable serine/threonine-protein kinase At1g09600 [Andrographis paniculata]